MTGSSAEPPHLPPATRAGERTNAQVIALRILHADKIFSADPVAREAARILIENDMGFAVKPSPRLYPHQWNWDSGFIAVGYGHFDVRRAERELLGLLGARWKNGMVPHIVFNPEAKDYFPGPEFWRTDLAANAPVRRDGTKIATSGHSQPPVLATSTRAVYEKAKAEDPAKALSFLKKAFPQLKHAQSFYHSVRDMRGDGIYYSIHPWETGRDNAPEWVELMKRIKLDKKPVYQRRDTNLIDASERPTEDQYDRYAHLVEVFREARWDEAEIRKRSPFLAEDVLTNALAYKDAEDLLWIAEELKKNATSKRAERDLDRDIRNIQTAMARTRASFSGRFWNDEKGLFYSRDLKTDLPIEINTVATFLPMYAGLATPAQAKRLVEEHLLNVEEYWTKFPLPSTSMSEKEHFDPKKYWLGPTWININWMVIQGLERYGYFEQAKQLKEKTLELVRKNGVFEYFDPLTGKGHGSDRFSWTAALVIDLGAR